MNAAGSAGDQHGTRTSAPFQPLGDMPTAAANQAASIFLTQLRTVHAHEAVNIDVPVRVGTLTLSLLETLRSSVPVHGDVLDVPFHQILDPGLRARNEADTWNALDLTPGKLLLIACTTADQGRTWQPLAALNVASAHDPQVEALRHLHHIQASTGMARNLAFLDAVESNNPILLSYVVDALAHDDLLNREDATGLLMKVFRREHAQPEAQREAGTALSSTFRAPGQDTAGQRGILITLSNALVSSPNSDQRANIAFLLASCVLGDNGADDPHIKELIRSVQEPGRHQVQETLLAVSLDPNAVSSEADRQQIAEVMHVWHASVKP